MGKVLGLLLIIVGGFLLFEGFERKEAAAAKPEPSTTGWIDTLQAAPHGGAHLACLAAGGLMIVAGITLGTRCRPDAS